MPPRRLLPALLVLLAMGWSTPAEAGRRPDFRGIAFGTPLAELPDMHPYARFGQVVFAHRGEDRPLFGESCDTTTRYAFSRTGLYAVRLTLTGCEDLAALIQAYETKYGRPTRQGVPGVMRLVWRLPTLSVELSHFARTGVTMADYVYLPDLGHDERETWQSPEDIRQVGPIGFRGLRFGRPIGEITGLVAAYKEGAAAYYRRRDDTLELGETQLADVLYGFWRGRFFCAVMRAKNAEDFDALRRAYQTKYGPPRAIPSTLEEELVWSWPKAQIALTRDTESGGLLIRYADADLLAEVVAAETAAGAPPTLSGGLRIFSRTDPPRSFRGAAFGSPAESLTGGEFLYSHRGRRYYRRAGDRLRLGDIPLSSILYAYDDNRLAGVTLVVTPSGGDPDQDYQRVLAAYAAKYGPPATRPGDDGGVLHMWFWPGLSIALSRPDKGPMEMHYVDAALLRRREARLATRALGELERAMFAPPATAASPNRPTGQE